MDNHKPRSLHNLLEQYTATGKKHAVNSSEFKSAYEHLNNRKVPILLQVLMFIGALLAACFFILFLGLIGFLESELSMLVLGVFFATIALFLPYLSQQKTAIEPLGMALLIAGASLFVAGCSDLLSNKYLLFLYLVLALSLFVAVVSASHLQKTAAILCTNLSLVLLIYEGGQLFLMNLLILFNATTLCYMVLQEPTLLAKKTSLTKWMITLMNGFSFALLGHLCVFVNSPLVQEGSRYLDSSYAWVSSLGLTVLVLWVLHRILSKINANKHRTALLIATGVALLFLLKAPGIIAGLLLLLLGYYGFYLYVGQGIMALFSFSVLFYYNLNTTLLVKSLLMVLAGLLFLAIGIYIKKVYQLELNQNKEL
jgi:hypothetical protein